LTKTAEAFRTISEVADELEVPKHVLRFWEGRFPQIRPMKRGGGRRYYRPEDMSLLRGICHLLHAEGYTIKGVQKILREQGVDTVKRYGADAAEPPAPVVATAPPAGKRAGRAGKKSAAAASAPAARGVPTKAEVRERLLAAIAELETCRGILLGNSPETAARRPAQKARRSARA
jgi:DNA-binding transcriptional MerR regulator